MAPSVQEYFPFHTDFTHTFCCASGVSGYKPYYSPAHPLNDFITDIKTCGKPRHLINGTKWHAHQPERYSVDQHGILALVPEDNLVRRQHNVKWLSDREKGVVHKCIVLVEYFPQSLEEGRKRSEMPGTFFGRPYYGRQGQKVWVGRAHAESHEMRMRREMEEYAQSLNEPPGIGEAGEAGERAQADGEKEPRLLWDWRPANNSEVVQATNEILQKSLQGVDGIEDDVVAQSWECAKCSEGKERVANPMKKWRFVVYYKDIKVLPGPADKDDNSDPFDRFKSTIPKENVKVKMGNDAMKRTENGIMTPEDEAEREEELALIGV